MIRVYTAEEIWSDDKFRRVGVAYAIANMRTMLRNANSPR